MPDVLAVDRLEVLVLVDNVTDSLSTNPGNVTPEWPGLLSSGRIRMISGPNTCCAHHGLSLSIRAGGRAVPWQGTGCSPSNYSFCCLTTQTTKATTTASTRIDTQYPP